MQKIIDKSIPTPQLYTMLKIFKDLKIGAHAELDLNKFHAWLKKIDKPDEKHTAIINARIKQIDEYIEQIENEIKSRGLSNIGTCVN